jgi:hypothetical protein
MRLLLLFHFASAYIVKPSNSCEPVELGRFI